MSFVKKILVPTDFSEPAKNALDYAVVLAKKTNAAIHLLHVYHIPVVDPYMPGDTMEAMLEETRKNSERLMTELVSETNYAIISHEVRMGFVSDDVISSAEENNIDLIVMGTTGASGLKEVFFGSVATSIINKSSIKVLAIPEAYTHNELPQTIVYAADFTDNESTIMAEVADFCASLGSNLKVFHVNSEESVFTDEPAKKIFENLASQYSFQNIEFAEVESKDVVNSIQEYTRESNCDMLAIAMHRRNIFERLFHKSKTKELAHHSKIPILALHKSR